jgi:hypothetical protein
MRTTSWWKGLTNYFAQADDRTVYYFGEVVNSLREWHCCRPRGKHGLVGGPQPSQGDSPETGKRPGTKRLHAGDPDLGDIFKPEDLFPIVDETGTIVGVDLDVVVLGWKYDGAIKVVESSQLAAGTESKWYAPGVGVEKVQTKGETLRLSTSTLVQHRITDAGTVTRFLRNSPP